MKQYKVKFTNPFEKKISDMPVMEGRTIKLNKRQIADILEKHDLIYQALFVFSDDFDDWLECRGIWSHEINDWFIEIEKVSA